MTEVGRLHARFGPRITLAAEDVSRYLGFGRDVSLGEPPWTVAGTPFRPTQRESGPVELLSDESSASK